MRVYYLILFSLLSIGIFSQKIDTAINSTFYPVEKLNFDSSFIRKNQLKRIVDVEYVIKHNKYKRRKEFSAKVFSQLGMLVEDYNIEINYRGGPNKTTYSYNFKNELIQVKEFYLNNNVRICPINLEKLQNERKSIVYNRRFWIERRDTIYNEKKQIIEIKDTSYTKSGVRETYEYDSLDRIKRKIVYYNNLNIKQNKLIEQTAFVIQFEYTKDGYKEIEKYFYDEIKDKYSYIDSNSKSIFYLVTIYINGFSIPVEEINYNPKTGKPKSSNKKEFEYYDK